MKAPIKGIGIKKLTALIMGISLVVTLIITYAYSQYIKKEAITHLSEEDARNTSLFIFESLYSAMSKGWDKDDIKTIIGRLNKIDNNLNIHVYRSQKVASLFGSDPLASNDFMNNSFIQQAMKGEESNHLLGESFIRYFFPIRSTQECLKCHTNVNPGDVLGVIDITYPIHDLKVSLSEIINFFIFFFIVFTIILFGILFFELDNYLTKPLRRFIQNINTITNKHDISERLNQESAILEITALQSYFNEMLDSLEKQFYVDVLTGLDNRAKLLESLPSKNSNATLILINIDGFHEINDFYGHESGDTLLKLFAENLKHLITATSWKAYRLHSDEFAFLTQEPKSEETLFEFIQFLSESLNSKTYMLKETNELHLNATFGIATLEDNLLTKADIALISAKRDKKEYALYNTSMLISQEYEKNLSWTKKIKEALKEDRVEPFYQPIVSNQDGSIKKYECLVRIIDVEGSAISPGHFLNIAKKSKLYPQITKTVIEKSFNLFKDLPYEFSINLTVEDILNDELIAYIKEKIAHYGYNNRVVFEILESEGIENFEQVSSFISEMKQYGCKIAIDDFGTGYSNFDYILKLNVDYLKIDASMIKNLDKNNTSKIITQTIVEFANKIGIQTIAEFVYSENIHTIVTELGIDYSQGFYLGEPVSASTIRPS